MRRGRGKLVTRGNDDAPGRLDPFTTGIDAGAGADGAQDDIGIGSSLICMLDEEFGGEAQVPAPAFV